MDDPDSFLFPRGIILDRDLTTIHELRMDDPDGIQEFVSHSWYDYSGGKEVGLHPWSGETNLNYSGPQPPYEHLDVEQSYSWLKSPRWHGKAMEVGPLARVLMLYVKGHELTQDLVNSTLSKLELPPRALFSTLGRTAARTLETAILAESMQGWLDALIANIKAGDTKTFDDTLWEPESWPSKCQGVGVMEAPRGGLSHWVVIEDGKIANYQAVVPSTWNAGPRDPMGQPGAYEAALAGRARHARSETAARDPAHDSQLRPVHRLRGARNGSGRRRTRTGRYSLDDYSVASFTSNGAGAQASAPKRSLNSEMRAYTFFESDRIGVVHRASAPCRKTVAVDINDVDVAGPLRDALFDDAHAFVDQRIDQAIDDFIVGYVATLDAKRRRLALDDLQYRRVAGVFACLRIVLIETGAGLLAQPAHLGEHVGDTVRARIAALRFGQRLAGFVTDVDTGKIGDAYRPHRHAPCLHRRIDLFRRRALDQAELRFAKVRLQHAVADEAVADAGHDRHLANSLRERHAGCQHIVCGLSRRERLRAVS